MNHFQFQAKDFERSAAVAFEGIADIIIPGGYLQFSADNVDYIPDTIYGKNSIHCMGLLGIVTPGCHIRYDHVKREKIDKSRILELSKNNIRYLYQSGVDDRNFFKSMVFKELDLLTGLYFTF